MKRDTKPIPLCHQPGPGLGTALAILLLLSGVRAQSADFLKPRMGGVAVASQYGEWVLRTASPVSAPGQATVALPTGNAVLPDSSAFQPLTPGSPIRIVDGAATETVIPESVQGCGLNSNVCSFTAIFQYAHPGAVPIASGTFGLQEAIQAMRASGGTVVLTPEWQGTAGMITGANGADNVVIRDERDGSETWYTWAGGEYVADFGLTAQGVTQPRDWAGVLSAAAFAGADVGAQINAAIAGLPAGGGTVLLPPGTSAFATPIVITKPGVTLAGQNNTVLDYTGAGDAIVLGALGSSSAGNLNLWTVLKDFSLNGTSNAANGIHCYNANAVTIRNVTVNSFGQDGLRLEFCQYGSVYDSVFGGNGGDGLDAPQAVISGFTRGGNEQSNTWVLVNDRFFSNAQWGVRLQAAREFTFVKPTYQDNGAGGRADTADLGDAVGGDPSGTPSGTYSANDYEVNAHYEVNAGYDYYCQYCTGTTSDTPTFSSSGVASGHWVVNNSGFNARLTLRNPEFLDSTQLQISLPSGAGEADIDLGNATASRVSIADPSALVHAGNVFYSALVGAPGQTFAVGPTDPNTGVVIQGGSATLHATSATGTIGLTIGSQPGWTLSGITTGARSVILPDNSGTLAETNLAQSWTGLQSFSVLQNECAGEATLVGGTVTISAACLTGARPITLSEETSGTPNALGYTQTVGSLTVKSASSSDTSVISWVQN